MAITICAKCRHKVSTLAPACPACGASPQVVASWGQISEAGRYFVLFILALVVFVSSPVTQLGDSKYSLLLSENILTNRTREMSSYWIPGLDFAALPAKPDLVNIGPFYQLARINGKLLYYYPHGSSLLSLPLVAALRGLGSSVVGPGGSYSEANEAREQLILASFLMAGLACVFLRTAEVMLPVSWSFMVAMGATFGTQVWSTATRALWSHTWEILLLGVVVLELLSAEEERRPLHMVWLASLASWMFFVRPTGAIVVVGITIYVSLYHRRYCLPYVVAGAAWLAGFIAYSWFTFGELLPGYYHDPAFRSSGHALEALAGSLVSPSRGLFVFVPELLVVALLVMGYWRTLPHRRLAVLAMAASSTHMLILTGDTKWWGGHCYGPRLLTDLVPWFVLLAILSLRAFRSDAVRASTAEGRGKARLRPRDGALVALAVLLLTLGVAINARGALSWETVWWSARPNIDLDPERVWDWQAPQFLAGLVPQR